jgi:hypothetical protein
MSTLATSSVIVNRQKCEEVANLLRSKQIPEDREEISFDGFTDLETGNLLFFVVAICHQTTVPGKPPLAGLVDGKLLKGWDYLLQRFVEVARTHKAWLNPEYWSQLNATQLRELYRNSEGYDLLTNVENRTDILVDLGAVMAQHGFKNLQDVYDLSKGWIQTEEPNLVDLLANFRAYSDPIRKKTFFLLSLMRNTGIWLFRDPENLGAPVDYHEVRGHLRIGTVAVMDAELRLKLLNSQRVTADEDIAIRGAVFEAIMQISELTGLRNPSKLHYMFWNVFRNYCTRDDPNSLGDRRETDLPQRYAPLAIDHDGRKACPFSQVCNSVFEERKYKEHSIDTEYY